MEDIINAFRSGKNAVVSTENNKILVISGSKIQDKLVSNENLKTFMKKNLLINDNDSEEDEKNIQVNTSIDNLQLDNTSDLAKPISFLQQEELNKKQDSIDFNNTLRINDNFLLGNDVNLNYKNLIPTLKNVDNTRDLYKICSNPTLNRLNRLLTKSNFLLNKKILDDNFKIFINSKNFSDLNQVDNSAIPTISNAFKNELDKYESTININANNNLSKINNTKLLIDDQNDNEATNIILDKNTILLQNVSNISDQDLAISTLQQQELDKYANLNEYTLATINGLNLLSSTSSSTDQENILIDKNTLLLDKIDNTSDVMKPCSRLFNTELNKLQDKLVNNVNIKSLNGAYSLIVDADENEKNVTLNYKNFMSDLLNVDNTRDLDKILSKEQITALSLKQNNVELKTINGVGLKINDGDGDETNLQINAQTIDGLNKVDNTSDKDKEISSKQHEELNKKLNKSDFKLKTINGFDLTINGTQDPKNVLLNKETLNLQFVTNTNDESKSLSKSMLDALALKQDVQNFQLKTFNTNIDFLINDQNEGSNIDVKKLLLLDQLVNTTDLEKPLNNNTQTELAKKQDIQTLQIKTLNNISLVGDGGSDLKYGQIFPTLSNVQNTSDIERPLSIQQKQQVDNKMDTIQKFAKISTTNNANVNILNNSINIDIRQLNNLNLLDNTSDDLKPISTIQKNALDLYMNINDESLTNIKKLVIKNDKIEEQHNLIMSTTKSFVETESNIVVTKTKLGMDLVENVSDEQKVLTILQTDALNLKHDKLISGQNFSTLNGASFLTSGNFSNTTLQGFDKLSNIADLDKPISSLQQTALDNRQSFFDHAQNIKNLSTCTQDPLNINRLLISQDTPQNEKNITLLNSCYANCPLIGQRQCFTSAPHLSSSLSNIAYPFTIYSGFNLPEEFGGAASRPDFLLATKSLGEIYFFFPCNFFVEGYLNVLWQDASFLQLDWEQASFNTNLNRIEWTPIFTIKSWTNLLSSDFFFSFLVKCEDSTKFASPFQATSYSGVNINVYSMIRLVTKDMQRPFFSLGNWNPNTNLPTISSSTHTVSTGSVGDYYTVSTTNSTRLIDGNSTWTQNDFIIWTGEKWERIITPVNTRFVARGSWDGITPDLANLTIVSSATPTSTQISAGNYYVVSTPQTTFNDTIYNSYDYVIHTGQKFIKIAFSDVKKTKKTFTLSSGWNNATGIYPRSAAIQETSYVTITQL